MLKHWIFWRIVQIFLDIVLLYGAFLLAYFIRVGWVFSSDFHFFVYAVVSFFSVFFWITFLIFTKYYRLPPRSGKRAVYDVILAFAGGIIAVSAVIVLYFFQQELFFSRLINLYILLFGTSFLFFSQWIFKKFLIYQKRKEKKVYRTLVVGANRVAEKLISAIRENPYAPYNIVGVIDPYGIYKQVAGSKILGKLDKLEMVCEKERISAVIQCDAFEHTINLISFCEEKNIKFQFDPALRGIFEKNLRIREVAGQMMISFVKRDFDNSKKRWLYRLGDWGLRQFFDID